MKTSFPGISSPEQLTMTQAQEVQLRLDWRSRRMMLANLAILFRSGKARKRKSCSVRGDCLDVCATRPCGIRETGPAAFVLMATTGSVTRGTSTSPLGPRGRKCAVIEERPGVPRRTRSKARLGQGATPCRAPRSNVLSGTAPAQTGVRSGAHPSCRSRRVSREASAPRPRRRRLGRQARLFLAERQFRRDLRRHRHELFRKTRSRAVPRDLA